MKDKFNHIERRGLPGGPNEQFTYVTGVFSTDGYRYDSPDVNNIYNVIPSGNISMREKNGEPLKKGPILGIDNLGNRELMQPGFDYQFPGDQVFELPMAQKGKYMPPNFSDFNYGQIASESTSRTYNAKGTTKPTSTATPSVSKQQVAKSVQEAQRLRKIQEDERRARIADAEAAKKTPYTLQNFPEIFARETQAIGDKLQSDYIPDILNIGLGNFASGLGRVPLNLQKGNYGQVALDIGIPLAVGALAGLGSPSTGQFANNLLNPLAGSGLGNYLTTKTPLKNTRKLNPFAENLNNPNSSYRVAGLDAAEDFKNSGVLRSRNTAPPVVHESGFVIPARPTSFPSFQKGYADMTYLPQEGGVVFKTDLPTFKRGDINPVSGNPIKSRHYAHRVIDPKTGNTLTEIPASDVKMFEGKPHWLKGYKEVDVPKQLPGSPNAKQAGFINLKGAFQKYPKGPLTQEEIAAYKNSPYYKKTTQEYLDFKNRYGDSWTLPNSAEENLQEAITTGNRSRINPTLYGGRNWGAADYTIAGLAATAYPGYAGIIGLAFSPPVVKNKVLNSVGITSKPGLLSSKDTTINITNRPMDFAKVNETVDGQIIIGGEFIEGTNNTVRKAEDWLTATDTYSDKEYPSKDIQSFYGIENGKFRVGKASDFKPNTEIVPRRFGATNINQAILNEGAMRLLDDKGNPIYQNTPNTGKFILYSPSTKEAEFNYINTGKSGVDKVNKFLKKNKDAQYIHLDNGRYEFYGLNPEGLSSQDFRDYYIQDFEREGNPGYNMVIKKYGGFLDKAQRGGNVLDKRIISEAERTAETIDFLEKSTGKFLEDRTVDLIDYAKKDPQLKNYVEPAMNYSKDWLFENIRPVAYPTVLSSIKEVFSGISGKNAKPGKDTAGDYNIGEEAWRMALDLNTKPKYFEKSQYKPEISTDKSATYYKLSDDVIDKQKLIDEIDIDDMKIGDEKYLQSLAPYINKDFMPYDEFSQIDPLQKFKISIGKDKKGAYLSIYDKYDFENTPLNSFTKPFEIYDRIYLDKEIASRQLPKDYLNIFNHYNQLKSKQTNSFIKPINKQMGGDIDIPSWLNPYNWGVKEYKGSFSDAYATARKAGEKEFMWNGKRISTDMKGEDRPESSFNLSRQQRSKIYNAVNPLGYPTQEIIPAIKRYANNSSFKDSYQSGLTAARKTPDEDAWAFFMGVPQQQKSISESKYKPSDAKDKNAKYYTLRNAYPNFDRDLFFSANMFFEDENYIEKHKSKNPNTITGLRSRFSPLAHVTFSKGEDEKGNYFSMYDTYDFPLPFQKKIGNPYEIYDRTYYKDYGDGKNKPMYYSDKELSELDVNKKNFDTLALQRELLNRGIKLPKSTKTDGSLDGILGQETIQALQNYQTANSPLVKQYQNANTKIPNKLPHKDQTDYSEEGMRSILPVLYKQMGGDINQPKYQTGNEIAFDIYKKYINGDYIGTLEEGKAKKTYDRLNRIYYKDAKSSGMSVPNYIMTNVLTLQ